MAKESGISQGSLYSWVQEHSGGNRVGKSRRPEDWSPEEKLKAGALADACALKKKPGRPRKDPELVAAEDESSKPMILPVPLKSEITAGIGRPKS